MRARAWPRELRAPRLRFLDAQAIRGGSEDHGAGQRTGFVSGSIVKAGGSSDPAIRTPVNFALAPFEFFVLPTRTRFPFRYGIASMTEVPQLYAVTRVSDGRDVRQGLAGEGLPPKWFTKDPATTFERDLPEMIG